MPDLPVSVALIGCGAVASGYYAPALAALEREGALRVSALLDPDGRNVDALRVRFPAAAAVDDVAALVARPVELAIVASPPRFHAEQTIAALRAGVAVLCEKPMATTVAEGEAMIAAAHASGRVLAVGFYRRFLPAARTIRDLLRSGRLGTVRRFHCAEGGTFRWPARSASFFERGAGGGVLADVGVHVLDLLGWWLGRPANVTYEDDAMGGVEANCRIQLDYAEGFSGEVRLSRDTAQPNRWVIECSDGWVAWHVHDGERIEIGVGGVELGFDATLRTIVDAGVGRRLGAAGDGFARSFVAQLRHVVTAIRRGVPALVSGSEGLESLRVIDECYRHRTLMSMPWLGTAELARAHHLSGAA